MTVLAQWKPDRYAAVAASCSHATPGGLSCLTGSHQNPDRISVATLTAALQLLAEVMEVDTFIMARRSMTTIITITITTCWHEIWPGGFGGVRGL